MSRSKLKCRLGEACDGGSCSKAADVAGHLIRPLFFLVFLRFLAFLSASSALLSYLSGGPMASWILSACRRLGECIFSACRATLNSDDEEVGVVQSSNTADHCVCCLLTELFLYVSFLARRRSSYTVSFVDLNNSFASVRSSC